MKNDLKNKFLSDSVLKPSFLCTYMWGFIAHVYAYFSDAFSHDSLVVYATIRERRWKIQLGRILVPVYRYLTRDGIEIPWPIGLLALFWLGLAVYLTGRVFYIRSWWGISLIAGLMVTNVTISTITASYIYELDFDMLSITLAVLAVYLWKVKKHGMWWGSLCVVGILGIYPLR